MPIEREFKYVLRSADELYAKLMRLDEGVTGRADIRQAYLSRGGRIRSRTWWLRDGESFYSAAVARIEYIFTYKHDLQDQPGCLEIETEISEADFNLAWRDGDHRIKKTRFLLPCENTKGVWEVDFFFDDDGIYLALAEFEVPAEAGPPDRLHPLVQEYLQFTVPEGDSRFSNRKLCDRSKVEKLLQEIA